MIRNAIQDSHGARWIDVYNPTAPELKQLALEFSLHDIALKDCLDPAHPPIAEKFTNFDFFIIRHADPNSTNSRTDNLLALTRKIAFFLGKDFLVTLHRADQTFIEHLHQRAVQKPPESIHGIFLEMLEQSLMTYHVPLDEAQRKLDKIEGQILGRGRSKLSLDQIYIIKRRTQIYKRVMEASHETLFHISDLPEKLIPVLRDVRDHSHRLFIRSDETLEEIVALLNLNLALASHRTNETMRILTLFSVIFMPLTFIVGVYGMNFRHMPELEWRFGYGAVWGTMVITVLGILIWFRKKQWWT